MEVSYRVRFLDLIMLNVYHSFRSPSMLIILLGGIGIISVLNWQTIFGVSDEYPLIVTIITFMIMEIPFILGYFILIFLTIVLANISKMNKTILTDCVVTLDADTVSTESKFARAEYKWNAIQKIVRTRYYLFLYFMQHGALIIPRRAFQSDEDFDKFWQECIARAKSN